VTVDDVRTADAVEAEAWTDMIAAAPPPFTAAVGLSVREIDGAICLVAPRIPVTLFNRVIGLGVLGAWDAASLSLVEALYAEAGSSRFWIHAGAASPPELSAALASRGFTVPPRARWAKVLRRGGTPPDVSPSLTVREPRPEERDAVAKVIVHAHGMAPPMIGWVTVLAARERWTTFGVFDGSEVVGGGLLYARAGRAWLGLGGVLESHRRRGGQRGLMAARIRRALETGHECIVTETGEPVGDDPNPSLANMLWAGFRRVDSRTNFESPPGTAG